MRSWVTKNSHQLYHHTESLKGIHNFGLLQINRQKKRGYSINFVIFGNHFSFLKSYSSKPDKRWWKIQVADHDKAVGHDCNYTWLACRASPWPDILARLKQTMHLNYTIPRYDTMYFSTRPRQGEALRLDQIDLLMISRLSGRLKTPIKKCGTQTMSATPR